MMLSSSMSAMTRISAPHREHVNGSLGCNNQFLLRSQRSQVRILSGAQIKSIWRNPVRRKSGLEEPAEVAASAVESADIPVAATVLGRVPAKIGCVGAARRGAEFDCGGDPEAEGHVVLQGVDGRHLHAHVQLELELLGGPAEQRAGVVLTLADDERVTANRLLVQDGPIILPRAARQGMASSPDYS